jgi:predicted DNA-binding transcriptional regulator AlpA
MPRDRVLRPREVATALGLSPNTLQKYRVHGIGPAFVRVGRRAVGYLESDVVTYLEQRRQPGDERQAG